MRFARKQTSCRPILINMASLPNTDVLIIVSSTGCFYAKHRHTKKVRWDYGRCEKPSKCWQSMSFFQFKPFWNSLIWKKRMKAICQYFSGLRLMMNTLVFPKKHHYIQIFPKSLLKENEMAFPRWSSSEW